MHKVSRSELLGIVQVELSYSNEQKMSRSTVAVKSMSKPKCPVFVIRGLYYHRQATSFSRGGGEEGRQVETG